jgi:hypothetical protein
VGSQPVSDRESHADRWLARFEQFSNLASASEFLVLCPYTREPYLPIPAEQIAAFRKLVELNFRDLQWTG